MLRPPELFLFKLSSGRNSTKLLNLEVVCETKKLKNRLLVIIFWYSPLTFYKIPDSYLLQQYQSWTGWHTLSHCCELNRGRCRNLHQNFHTGRLFCSKGLLSGALEGNPIKLGHTRESMVDAFIKNKNLNQ